MENRWQLVIDELLFTLESLTLDFSLYNTNAYLLLSLCLVNYQIIFKQNPKNNN